MAAVPDPIVIINLLLCIIICILGYLVYRKHGKVSAILIGIAFGMFSLSHLSVLLGLTLFPEATFILLRVCAYTLIAGALWLLLSE